MTAIRHSENGRVEAERWQGPERSAQSHADVGTPPRELRYAFIFVLLTLTLLDRFGLRLSATYSINPSTIALYGVVAAMLLSRTAHVNLVGAMLYIAAVTIACSSLLINMMFDFRQLASVSSLMLLCVLYAPFLLVMPGGPEAQAMWHWFMRWFLVFMAVLAAFGIAQYFAQFVVRIPWLIDFTSYIPAPIRGSGTYNTSNVMGSSFKSNGFFLREASGFSLYMSLALICEWSMARRKWLLALFGLGLVVSYSGSGMLILVVALLLPLGFQTFVRATVAAIAGVAVFFLFGDALNLNYTVGRVGEFGSDRSSAYCRFIAPAKLVAEQIESSAWTTLLGHGAGTTQRISGVCETTYGKLLFEYGLLGGLVFSALIIAALRRSWIPLRLRAALAVNWYLLGGNLLGPESLMMIFCFSGMWPARKATAVEAAADDPARPSPGPHNMPVSEGARNG